MLSSASYDAWHPCPSPRAHLQAANEAKSEFMSLMCHEVRTPLNGCLASAEMLLDTELDVSGLLVAVPIVRVQWWACSWTRSWV